MKIYHELKKNLKGIKTDPEDIRKFGLLFLLFFLVYNAYLRNEIDLLSFILLTFSIFFAIGIKNTAILKPFYKVWMGLALVVGFFVSRVILMILFFILITPIGLALRFFKKDFFGKKINKKTVSYWIEKNDGEKSSSLEDLF